MEGVNSTTTNLSPTSGGTNTETDAALIERFKKTVFRSMAGTADMFMGVALEDTTPDNPDDETATQATVIGSSKRWREQVQVVMGGSGLEAVSTIPVANVKGYWVRRTAANTAALSSDGATIAVTGDTGSL